MLYRVYIFKVILCNMIKWGRRYHVTQFFFSDKINEDDSSIVCEEQNGIGIEKQADSSSSGKN